MMHALMSIINRIIVEDEGGWKFTNHSHDAGGMTFAGVTYNTYRRHFPIPLPQDAFANLAREAEKDANHPLRNEIRQVYFDILLAANVELVPEPLRGAYSSCVVVFGEDDAIWALQNTYNEIFATEPPLKCDGVWGPKTAAAIQYMYNSNVGNRWLRQTFCHWWAMRHVEKTIANTTAWFDFLSQRRTKQPAGRFIVTLQGWMNRVNRYRIRG